MGALAASSVTRTPAWPSASRGRAILQRCGSHPCAPEGCTQRSEDEQRLQRSGAGPVRIVEAPPIVHDVLRSYGHPLEAGTRALFERRLGHDFGHVRIHTDILAEASARAVDALAYTVGPDVVFGSQQYRPETTSGRQLIAHELTHVRQQRWSKINDDDVLRVEPSHSESEAEARAAAARVADSQASTSSRPDVRAFTPAVARADPQSVALTLNLGRTARTGLQFWPTNVNDTRVGPVTVQGGLFSAGASQLNVIVGEGQTIRVLARELLVLWTTATPFTPPGGGAPLALDIITEDVLARGLLVFNQTYLPVPSMTGWRAGLRFPLPVEIDEATGVATLHPLLIRALAGGFDPAWVPLLDRRASAIASPPAAMVTADVTAFLAAEPTAEGRGIHLGARALTNAPAELPFNREAFRQLGPASFDVALSFMDNLVNREIQFLAAQRDGAAILALVRTALGGAPATPTAQQQASLTRAARMLGLVAGIAAVAPPGATRTRAEKSVTIDTVRLDGSTHTPARDVEGANAILAQCNVRLAHGVDATASAAETTGWLGGNTDLIFSGTCGTPTAEMSALFAGASARFGLSARIRAFFPATMSGTTGRGVSVPPYCATGAMGPLRNMAAVQSAGNFRSLAHEVTHILANTGTHYADPNLMSPAGPVPQGETLTDDQCSGMYANA